MILMMNVYDDYYYPVITMSKYISYLEMIEVQTWESEPYLSYE